MTETPRLLSGWFQYQGPMLNEFWLDGYPPAEHQGDPEVRQCGQRGSDGLLRVGTALMALRDDGGIALVQWLNITADKAVLLRGDGDWREGGEIRIFASPGAYRRPFELTSPDRAFRYPVDPDAWKSTVTRAVAWVETAVLPGMPAHAALRNVQI